MKLREMAVIAAGGNPTLRGVRDPEYPCADYDPGEPSTWSECETDGHYMCGGCRHRKIETAPQEGE